MTSAENLKAARRAAEEAKDAAEAERIVVVQGRGRLSRPEIHLGVKSSLMIHQNDD